MGFFQYWVDEADYATTQRFRHTFTGSKFKKVILDDTVIFPGITTTSSDTLTNKTIDADDNTISNLEHGSEVDNPSSGVHGVTGSVVGTTDTQTLSAKTLTTPTIGSFTNATHNHVATAGGGVRNVVPINFRSGLNCKQASTVTITVEGGAIDVNGTAIEKTSDTTLNLTTDAHWVGGTSQQTTGAYGWIYVDASGNVLMENSAPDESDTSGNTSGILRYNDFGGATDYRCIGWFYMNATGAGELNSYEVSNLADGIHNAVVRTDSTQNAVTDTSYNSQLTNTQVHFYSSGKGFVEAKCVINGNQNGTSEYAAILNDGSDIAASEQGGEAPTAASKNSTSCTPTHAERYSQGGITFEAKALVEGNTWTVEEKTMIIKEI